MTQIVLLSAGQGKRLSPLTDQKPKCLVPIAGKALLEWQLLAIEACQSETRKIDQVTIVTGFGARSVEAAVKTTSTSLSINCLYNPFYSVADNIGSCWAAKDILRNGGVLINGDTLFDRRILTKLLDVEDQPITVTVDHKDHYDSDDMKVKLSGDKLNRIGKTLEDEIDGESIGMLRFQENGGQAFTNEIENLLQDPASLKLWYLSIIDRLAQRSHVGVMSIDKLPWQEVDYPHDVAAAANCVKMFDWDKSAGALEGVTSNLGIGGQEL